MSVKYAVIGAAASALVLGVLAIPSMAKHLHKM
jgi:hypothetical protein